MNRSISRKTAVAALIAAAMGTDVAFAGNKYWVNGATGTWSNSANWSPSGLPTVSDPVFIGNSIYAMDGQCMIDVDPIIAGLTINDGMFVDNRYNFITVNGDTSISGINLPGGGGVAQFWLRSSSLNPYELSTHNLTVSDGAYIRLIGLARVNVTGTMLIDGASQFYGAGIVNLQSNSGPAAVIDGHMSIDADSSLTFNQNGSGRIDLDGGVAGDQIIAATYYSQKFTVNGDQLTDAFDDTFWIGNSSTIDMNLSGGWTLGNVGKIVFLDDSTGGVARLTGGTMTVAGQIYSNVPIGYDVDAMIEAPVVFNPTATVTFGDYDHMTFTKNVTVGGGQFLLDQFSKLVFNGPATVNQGSFSALERGDEIEFNGTTTVNGGQFNLGHFNGSATFPSAELFFNGATTVTGGTFNMVDEGYVTFNGAARIFGGTFNTPNTDPTDGHVRFNGPTEFKNTVTINGVGVQNGAATVNYPTTINAELFDLDGKLSLTSWSINAPLTLNVDGINAGNNVFTGEMDLISTSSSAAKLAVNLPAGTGWNMSGQMTMIGSGVGTSTDVISGSDVRISGQLTVSFENAISARATFASTNTATINSSSGLRLDGGNLVNVNRIEGATIKGAGTLRSTANHALTGYGTISTAVAFGSAELRADGGVLNLNGPISSVGIIAAQPSSTLKFGTPFNTSVATRMELNGGAVSGFSVTNSSGKEIRGQGFITTAGLNNGGTLSALGGTLAVDTTSAPDIDGSGDTGRLTINSNSELYFADTPNDDFDGDALVAPGGMLRFEQAWTLGVGGALRLSGIAGQPATVAAGLQAIKGEVLMAVNTQATFNAPTTFAPSAKASLASGATLAVIQDSSIAAGGSFGGGGTLRNGPGAKMTLAHGATVGVNVANDGTLEINGVFPGLASVGSFSQATGTMRMDLNGATPGTLFDRLNVTGVASVGGTLSLSTGLYNPGYLISHEIIHAAGITGQFGNVAGLVLSPTKYLAVTYDADSVLVTAALPGDANLDGSVNLDDFTTLAANFGGSGSWVSGSFDGNSAINLDDFTLLASIFGMHVPAAPVDFGRGTAVPEPIVTAWVLLAAHSLTGRRRRCTQDARSV